MNLLYLIFNYFATIGRSVFVQWNPSNENEKIFTGVGWLMFSNDSIISKGMSDIQKYPNGWIKKTTGEECFTKPVFCLVENFDKAGRYFFYTDCSLDKNIVDMSNYLLHDIMVSSYMIHDNVNLIEENVLDIIIKEGNFLPPPPRQQYPLNYKGNVK